MPSVTKGLTERLKDGETVILAEGYLFEFERRGYLKAGAYVPEVVLEHPHLVKALYEEFVHCGSDVVLAFTYYGHRAKLEVIGKVSDLESLNRKALKLARTVADETGTLMAGNICNTTVWKDDKESQQLVRDIFKEQIEWAVEEGADFILGETFGLTGEAMAALECIKAYGNGIPAVINLVPGFNGKTFDGLLPLVDACKKLEDAGADCIGLNCHFGPDTIIDLMKDIRTVCKVPIACIPVPFRTNTEYPAMQNLIDHKTGKKAFPDNLAAWQCSRSDIEHFTKTMKELDIQLIGLCCGNMGSYIRTMAETLGRTPGASKYSPNMSSHCSNIADPKSRELYAARFK